MSLWDTMAGLNKTNEYTQFTQVFFYIEFINHQLMEYFRENKKYNVEILHKTWKILKANSNWNELKAGTTIPEVLNHCLNIGLEPEIEKSSLIQTFSILLRPYNLEIDKNSNFKRINQNKRIRSFQFNFYSLGQRIYTVDTDLGKSFTFIRPNREKRIFYLKSKCFFLDEPFDFISILQRFIAERYNYNDYAINHKIQLWIRNIFKLNFNSNTKYTFSDICNQIRYLFFSDRKNSSYMRKPRSNVLGLNLLINTIFLILIDECSSEKEAIKKSIGIYAFLKFSKSLRIRYFLARKGPR